MVIRLVVWLIILTIRGLGVQRCLRLGAGFVVGSGTTGGIVMLALAIAPAPKKPSPPTPRGKGVEQKQEFSVPMTRFKSVKGLRRVEDLRVDLVVDEGGADFRRVENLPASLANGSDSWGLTIQGNSYNLGNEAMKDLTLQVWLPADKPQSSRRAYLVVTGKLAFPHMVNFNEFDDGHDSLNERVDFTLLGRAEVESHRQALQDYEAARQAHARAAPEHEQMMTVVGIVAAGVGLVVMGVVYWVSRPRGESERPRDEDEEYSERDGVLAR